MPPAEPVRAPLGQLQLLRIEPRPSPALARKIRATVPEGSAARAARFIYDATASFFFLTRARWRAALARLPQLAMSHQRRHPVGDAS